MSEIQFTGGRRKEQCIVVTAFTCKKLEADSLISTRMADLFLRIVVTYAWLVVLTLLGIASVSWFLDCKSCCFSKISSWPPDKTREENIVINIQVSQLPLHVTSHIVPGYGLSFKRSSF
jgi:hypothetical protein